MKKCGLVSISFRSLTPEQILPLVRNAGLAGIEWGSDVHAPPDNEENLRKIARMQAEAGLVCTSYGTYFRIGKDMPEEILSYIRAATVLGTDILRLWCGTKGYAQYTAEEKEALFADCRALAGYAAQHNVRLCMECHNNTFTDTPEGALELMQAVDSPFFGMYWQPNQYRTVEQNVSYARAIAAYTTQIHVFQWKREEKFPLALGKEEWQRYLSAFEGEHWLLLEFMPDGKSETLAREAQTLLHWMEEGK